MRFFDTFSDYLRFVKAREFTYRDGEDTPFPYEKNRCEKIGEALAKPVIYPLDFIGRNSRNPLLIAALSVTGVFIATLMFYPSIVAVVLTATVVVCLKAAAFTLTQATIVGLALRTLGRLNNQELMKQWTEHRLCPQTIGSIRV